MRICILSPAPIHGSGGLRTIFNYAVALRDAGMEVDMVLVDAPQQGRDAEAELASFYGIEGLPVRHWPSDLGNPDMVVATRWDTARIARDTAARSRAYLVQDYESMFHPMGDSFLAGENGYLFGLETITLGRWLNQTLTQNFGNRPYRMDFGVDLAVYSLQRSMSERSPGICAILQPEKPRRCTHLLVEALGIVAANFPDVPIRLYGGKKIPLWFKAEQLGIIPPEELARLYNDSTVGVCMSSSNPSRIPFEMMACGLPVVDLYRSNNLLDLPEQGCLLAHQTPESIAEAIAALLVHQELASDLSAGGAQLMLGRSAAAEVAGFVRAITAIAAGEPTTVEKPEAWLYRRPAVIGPSLRGPQVLRHCARQVELLGLPAVSVA